MGEFELTNDLLFQRVFGKVGNENITKGFLEKVLGIEIESLTLDTNKRLIGENLDDKIGRVDVKAILNTGTKVIIEMQVVRYKYMAKRLLYYWSQTYSGDLKRGREYDRLNKTIAILISVEELEETKGIEKYHTSWHIREDENLETKLTNDLEIHVIELNKFKEGQEPRPEDNWIRALKSKGVDEMSKISENDKHIQELREELERITADPELRERYDYREKELRDDLSRLKAEREDGLEEGYKTGLEKGRKEGFNQGIEQGIQQGVQQGIEEKNKEIVLNMHKKNMDIETISEIVNISKEEVEKIIVENSSC